MFKKNDNRRNSAGYWSGTAQNRGHLAMEEQVQDSAVVFFVSLCLLVSPNNGQHWPNQFSFYHRLYFMYNIRTYCMIFMACLIFHLLDAYRDKKRRYIMKIRNQSQNLDESKLFVLNSGSNCFVFSAIPWQKSLLTLLKKAPNLFVWLKWRVKIIFFLLTNLNKFIKK